MFQLKFNWISFLLILLAIIAIAVMIIPNIGHTWFVDNIIGIMMSLLILWGGVYSSESGVRLNRLDSAALVRGNGFKFDFFVMNVVVTITIFTSIIFQKNNIDVQGWWVLMTFFAAIEGLIFAVIFSAFAQLLGSHKKYTLVVASLLLPYFLWMFSPFHSASFIFDIKGVWFSLGELFFLFILLHILFCLIYRLIKKINGVYQTR